MKIVGFGASSMQGAGDPEGGFFKRVSSFFESAGSHFEFVNLGVGGDTTIQMLERLPRVTKEKPEMTIVLLGCNDMPRVPDASPLNRTSLEQYKTNLSTILSTIQAKRSLFISSFEVDPIKTGISLELFQNYMDGARELAENLGYEIWDLLSETRAQKAEFLATDGVHYNGLGHAYIAGKLISKLQDG